MRARSPNEVLNWLVVVLAFSLPLYRAWVSLAATLIIILWFVQGDLRHRIHRLKRHRLTLAVVAFMALNLLSLIWSDNVLAGLDYWEKYTYFLLVPAVASSLRPKVAKWSLAALAAGTVLSVSLMPVVIFADIRFGRAHPGNPAATMSHLDTSMVLAAVAVLILVHLAHTTLRPRRRLIWIMVFLVVVGGLLLNIGRSGQVAFIATLPVLVPLLLHRQPIRVRAAAVLGVVAAVMLVYAIVPRFQDRVDAASAEIRTAVVENRIDSNQGKRVAGAIVAGAIVAEHPVLGTGIGDNMPAFQRQLDTRFSELREAIGWFPHFHNQYLQVTTELGVVGLVSLLAIFATFVTGRYRRPEARAAAVALSCVYLVGFFGDPFFHKQITLVLFALAAGVISADDEAFFEESSQSTVDS
ncbi:MAG: O-antigen ligase family protein [Thermoanaerobaculales bacterium]|jgi:O-antigen ligase|nr:O-antigen ligase family protein [Thermoanaerobaculales bacterium]